MKGTFIWNNLLVATISQFVFFLAFIFPILCIKFVSINNYFIIAKYMLSELLKHGVLYKYYSLFFIQYIRNYACRHHLIVHFRALIGSCFQCQSITLDMVMYVRMHGTLYPSVHIEDINTILD